MTLEETNNCEIIDELIRQGRSFAMYRNALKFSSGFAGGEFF